MGAVAGGVVVLVHFFPRGNFPKKKTRADLSRGSAFAGGVLVLTFFFIFFFFVPRVLLLENKRFRQERRSC